MSIVKINIHKLVAERNLDSKGGQININNNVSLKSVEDGGYSDNTKKSLKFTFAFNCSYEPDLGKIEVEGQIFVVDDAKKIDDIKKDWETEKKIPMNLMEEIINASLHKGNIEAIKFSEEVSLPSPLPLPKIKATAAQGAKPGKAEEKRK